MKTSDMTINLSSVDKQSVVCPYNGIVFVNRKGMNIHTCYNMDQPCKHYARSKKPVTKTVYMRFHL